MVAITAEMVTRRGGVGLPVRCDHTADEDTSAVIERARSERGRLDILVNNAWGGHDDMGRGAVPLMQLGGRS